MEYFCSKCREGVMNKKWYVEMTNKEGDEFKGSLKFFGNMVEVNIPGQVGIFKYNKNDTFTYVGKSISPNNESYKSVLVIRGDIEDPFDCELFIKSYNNKYEFEIGCFSSVISGNVESVK